MFTPVVAELVAGEPKKAGLDLLHKTKLSKYRTVEPVLVLTKISEAPSKLEGVLDAMLCYVEAVLAGREEADNSAGRALHGHRPVRDDVEQQLDGSPHDHPPVTADEDTAAAEQEALHDGPT